MPDDIVYYDAMSTDMPRAVSNREIEELDTMFRSQGWQIFMSIKRLQAQAHAAEGLKPDSSEKGIAARALYTGDKWDLRFQHLLREVAKSDPTETEPRVEKSDIDVDSLPGIFEGFLGRFAKLRKNS